MKVFLAGQAENPKRFGGTTPLVAQLDDAVIDAHGLRAPLESFGRDLAEQMVTRYTQPASGAVIGVELRLIEFSLILGPK